MIQLVIIESPYAPAGIDADHPLFQVRLEGGIHYARQSVRDALQRGESPIASHLLLTQPGILNDANPGERRLGIEAGLAWYRAADRAAFYLDRGMSAGMAGARTWLAANTPHVPIEYRYIRAPLSDDARTAQGGWFQWESPTFGCRADGRLCETPHGRLAITRHARPPSPGAAFEAAFNDRVVAFYRSMAEAMTGLEYWYLDTKANSAIPTV